MKQKLRNDIRQRRRILDGPTRASHDQSINRHLVQLAAQRGAKSLAAFFAFDGEPDLKPALTELAGRGVRIALPVIIETDGVKNLQFRAWDPETALVKNPFGIEEPADSEVIPLAGLDLVMLPLVAWDRQGNRLGMGAGYYDRLFAEGTGKDHPRRVGVAYGIQETGELPADPWDVPLHEIITEKGRFTCAG